MIRIRSAIKNYYLLLGLIVISLPYRFYNFTFPLLDSNFFRQTQTATIALNFYKSGINLLRTELDIFGLGKERYLTLEFPLYQAIVSLFYKIFFVSDIWGRTITIISGYIAALYLYKLIILLTGRRQIAFLTTFFFLFTPLNIFYLRSVMIDPFVVMLLLIGTYYGCLWITNKSVLNFVIGTIFLSLGFIHKGLYGPFWLLPLVIYSIKKAGYKDRLILRLCLILFPLMALFLWQNHVNRTNSLFGHEYFTTGNISHLEWNFGSLEERLVLKVWVTRIRMLVNGIFLKPGLIFFLVGLFYVRKYDRNNFLFYWLVSQILYFVILFRIQQHTYYQLIMIPAISAVTGIGLYQTLHFIRIKKSVKSILLVTIFILFIYKSWINTLPSFYMDWNWYGRLLSVKDKLFLNRAGILVTPGYDWNSVYTYIPGKKMLLVETTEIEKENLFKWKALGYDFVLVHKPESYSDYFRNLNSPNSLIYLNNYKKTLSLEDFEIYLL